MKSSPDQFAYWLTQAVRLIKATEGKDIHIIQDELALALGRGSGEASIGYWRKGHTPADLQELVRLADLLAGRGGLGRHSYGPFLASAGHPQAAALARERFPSSDGAPLPARPLPYNPNRPITDPRRFFGRERECRRIFTWLLHEPLQDIALIGPQKSGRTSLLHYLRAAGETPATQLRPGQRGQRLPDPDLYRWATIDFHDARWFSPANLLRSILVQLDFPVPHPLTLDTFMGTMSDGVTARTIIMLDELSAALELPGYDLRFWNSMRALATSATSNRLAFIITAADDPPRLAAHYGKTSPFFNLFSTIRVGPLTDAAARELIAASPLPFAPADVTWILNQSRLWPVLLQMLCQERLAALAEGDDSDVWRVEAARHLARYAHLVGTPPAATGDRE